MIHALKTHKKYFNEVISGKKMFEVRKNDRDFQVGDFIALNELGSSNFNYSGRSCIVRIIYIFRNTEYCKEGYVIIGFKPCFIDDFDIWGKPEGMPTYTREGGLT